MPAESVKNAKKKILIVEDEHNIAQLLAFNLMQAGYDFDIASDGAVGLSKALKGDFDLILLDLMLPKMDGFEVCRQIRTKLSTPIIIVTAREEEIDKILGLDIGADDYVTKPFKIKELLARVKANIRRSSNEMIVGGKENGGEIIRIRNLSIDTEKYQVMRGDEAVPLTKKEYELLVFLANNIGKPFTREELLEKVWGYEGFYGDLHTVDVTISRLRDKIRTPDNQNEYIFTKRGIGYYFK